MDSNNNEFENENKSKNENADADEKSNAAENGGSGDNSDSGDNGDNIESILNIKPTREMIDSQYFVPEENKKRFAEEAFDWIEIFSSALITVILLFTFIFRLVTVEGPSMQETLHEKDNLIISHLFYSNPKQNDIVVIQLPNTEFEKPIIKRVIAVENQKVRFDFENWIVYVDDVPLDEPYVKREMGLMRKDRIEDDDVVITVEPGKIFVMGDNRNNSTDSRSSIGQVEVRNVVGRVLIRIFPINKFGVVKPNAS